MSEKDAIKCYLSHGNLEQLTMDDTECSRSSRHFIQGGPKKTIQKLTKMLGTNDIFWYKL